MRVLAVFLICLRLVAAIEVVICDCTNSRNLGFLKTKEECNLEEQSESEPAYYEVTSYRREKIKLTGHFCSLTSKVFKAVTYGKVTEMEKISNLPTRLRISQCLRMAGIGETEIHTSPANQIMDKIGNKWTSRQVRGRSSPRMEEISLYENVTLIKECQDCPILTVFGPIEKIEITERKNETTWNAVYIDDGILTWKEKDEEFESCRKNVIEDGQGVLYKIDNNTYRIASPEKQIDFIISKNKTTALECDISLEDDDFWAVEMTGIIIKIHVAEKVIENHTNNQTSLPVEADPSMEPTDHNPSSTSIKTQVLFNNTNPTNRSAAKSITSPNILRQKRNLKDDIKETSHLSFKQNKVIDQENVLVNAIKVLQCVNKQNKVLWAIQTARTNGWLAAKQLDFQTCSKLTPVGNTAQLEICSPTVVNISVRYTICGPQPVINENFTINLNGFETAKFANCYHKGNWININGSPYVFESDDWIKQEEKITTNEQGLINKFAYNADNSLETFINMDPETNNVIDQFSILADIAAVINEHAPDAMIGTPHASSALIQLHEKENHSLLNTIATWLKYFGGISITTISILTIFRVFGGQSILKKFLGVCGLPSWATNLFSGNLLGICKQNKTRDPIRKENTNLGHYTVVEINPNSSTQPKQIRNKRPKSKKRNKDKRSRRTEIV
jgi:hypothetical protein